MAQLVSETTFKREFRKIVGGWSETIEPARGGGMGVPDVFFMVPKRGWLYPVEMKVGEGADGVLFPSRLRPAQIGWLDGFGRAGGKACVLVGVPERGGKWSAWARTDVTVEGLRGWKAGWEISDLLEILRNGELRRSAWEELISS